MVYLLNRLTLVFVMFFLIGCTIQGQSTEIITIARDQGDVSVYFCPTENCSSVLNDFILSSNKIDCAFFDFDLEDSIQLLSEKNYRLIVDSDNFEYVEHLDNVKQDNRSAFMHNKFCVSGKRVLTGSMNPTFNGVNKNNNNLVIIESQKLAENYKKEFEEMWNGVFGKGKTTDNQIIKLNGTKIENYFCPEDYCADKIKNVLEKAEESIYFMTFSFTHEAIANVILLKSLKNISVNGVFESRSAGSEYSKFKVMEYQGLNVKRDSNPATMHHKVFIIDESIVITGSFNPSNNADKYNDENVLIIYDEKIAKEFIEEYENL